MNLKQALYIQTIAREGGVTAAAKKLYISQPSLSQMLRQIESELGVPLFERGSLPLRPTYAGERYLHAAQVILSANEALENELREIRQENGGRLRLGISMQRSPTCCPGCCPASPKPIPTCVWSCGKGAAPCWNGWCWRDRWIWLWPPPSPPRRASPTSSFSGRPSASWPGGQSPGPPSPAGHTHSTGAGGGLLLCLPEAGPQHPGHSGPALPVPGPAALHLSGDRQHGGRPADDGAVRLLYALLRQLPHGDPERLLSPGRL